MTTTMRKRKDPPRPLSAAEIEALMAKPALTYDEVEALGYCTKRKLRVLVATKQVKRSVLRAGRLVRFLPKVLVEELQAK